MDIEQERKAFEAWYSKDFYAGLADISDTWCAEKNTYVDYAHHISWQAWQARAKQTITLPVKDATGEH